MSDPRPWGLPAHKSPPDGERIVVELDVERHGVHKIRMPAGKALEIWRALQRNGEYLVTVAREPAGQSYERGRVVAISGWVDEVAP